MNLKRNGNEPQNHFDRLTRYLVSPILVIPGTGLKMNIPDVPGPFRYSPDMAVDTALRHYDLGIRAFAIIGSGLPGSPLPGSAAVDTAIRPALRLLRSTFADARLIVQAPRPEPGRNQRSQQSSSDTAQPDDDLFDPNLALELVTEGADLIILPPSSGTNVISLFSRFEDRALLSRLCVAPDGLRWLWKLPPPPFGKQKPAPATPDITRPSDQRLVRIRSFIDTLPPEVSLFLNPLWPNLDIIAHLTIHRPAAHAARQWVGYSSIEDFAVYSHALKHRLAHPDQLAWQTYSAARDAHLDLLITHQTAPLIDVISRLGTTRSAAN